MTENKTSNVTPDAEFLTFKQSVKTLMIATLTSEGQPNASYAPFVEDEAGNFYIFVSQLASHTQDLLANPVASVLLLQDEQDTRQIFARQRISYQCQCEVVSAEEPDHNAQLAALEQRFGNVVELLQSLPDFLLFRLQPQQGRYVKGFGKAYQLSGEKLQTLVHVSA